MSHNNKMPFFIQRNNNKKRSLRNILFWFGSFFFGKKFQEIKPRKEKAKIKERIENEKRRNQKK